MGWTLWTLGIIRMHQMLTLHMLQETPISVQFPIYKRTPNWLVEYKINTKEVQITKHFMKKVVLIITHIHTFIQSQIKIDRYNHS